MWSKIPSFWSDDNFDLQAKKKKKTFAAELFFQLIFLVWFCPIETIRFENDFGWHDH